MIDFTPSAIAIQIGPLPIYWYGIAYAVGLAAAYLVMVRQAEWYGEKTNHLGDGLIVVAIAALIGGRLYHVIDQWALYRDDPIKIILPPYSGLGVYGGIVTGTIVAVLLVRYWKLDLARWADIVAPGLFVMQAIGRWGNFFNQELYGPPTTLPWGIAIDCAHRVTAYACPPGSDPTATLGQHFQPLFLYESISGLIGAAVLIWLSRHRPSWLRSGDLLLIFFVWYGVTRFVLENLRTFQVFEVGGVPTAQLFSLFFGGGAFLLFLYRHRRPEMSEDEPGEDEPLEPLADEPFAPLEAAPGTPLDTEPTSQAPTRSAG